MSSVKVTISKLGGQTVEVEASTVEQAIKAYGLDGNYSAKVNGVDKPLTTALDAGQHIMIGDKVKGGSL